MLRGNIVVAAGPEALNVLQGVLGPEVGKEIPKTSASVSLDEKSITLTIEAEDLASFRAAVNSYLRWLQIGIDTVNEVKGGE